MPRGRQVGRHRASQARGTAAGGVATLLPALFLSALYVAAPFAGTTTYAIADRCTATTPATTTPGTTPGTTARSGDAADRGRRAPARAERGQSISTVFAAAPSRPRTS